MRTHQRGFPARFSIYKVADHALGVIGGGIASLQCIDRKESVTPGDVSSESRRVGELVCRAVTAAR